MKHTKIDEKYINSMGNLALWTSKEDVPDYTLFDNIGFVNMAGCESMGKNIIFNNNGNVCLNSLKVIPEGTIFNNKGDIIMFNIKKIPDWVVFNNTGYVALHSPYNFDYTCLSYERFITLYDKLIETTKIELKGYLREIRINKILEN